MNKLLTDIAAVLATAFMQMADRQVASWTFPLGDDAVKVTVERVGNVTKTVAYLYADNDALLGIDV